MLKSKTVVLASGGLDSTVTAAIAKSEGYELYFLTIDYGQRHRTEIDCAQKISEFFEVKEHKIIQLDLRTFGGSALTDQIPVPAHQPARDREQQIPITYVPARNTIFLSLALAYAEVLDASSMFFGANIRDYSGYPDCRPAFIQAFKDVARLGTRMGLEGQQIDILAPLLFLTKREIIQKGFALGVPFQWTNSCYNPGRHNQPCGHCDSCVIRQEGFEEAQLPDPLLAG
ncbi:MAG: 7-cyano-7-deazaguanine synthase QueC [Nitrospirales bacterium]|nr:7-cyano-7-deazaguanine synthase QueC [Nitrospirales bacterium]